MADWTQHRRWEAVRSAAARDPTIARDFAKLSQPRFEPNPKLDGENLTITFDLRHPLVPQFTKMLAEAEWRQRQLGFKLKRAAATPPDREFELGLNLLKLRASGLSFQKIGNQLWPHDSTAKGRKAKAFRLYQKILAVPRHRRLQYVRSR